MYSDSLILETLDSKLEISRNKDLETKFNSLLIESPINSNKITLHETIKQILTR